MFVVTPDERDGGDQHLAIADGSGSTGKHQVDGAHLTPTGRGSSNVPPSPSLAPSLGYSADGNSSTAAYPPSPTFSAVSWAPSGSQSASHSRRPSSSGLNAAGDDTSSNYLGHSRSRSGSRSASFSLRSPGGGDRSGRSTGHSPTKSVDSSFHTYLDVFSNKQQQQPGQLGDGTISATAVSSSGDRSHSRRPSAATDLSAFTAIDGPRAAEQVVEGGNDPHDPPIAPSDASISASPKMKRKGILGKIPLIKRWAPLVPEDEGALTADLPDPSLAEMGPFNSLFPSSLYKLISPKNLDHLQELGGIEGLEKSLLVDSKSGLSEQTALAGASVQDRKRIYGENRIPARKQKSLLHLMWLAFQDKIIILLAVAAVVSLALGIYQDVGQPPKTYESPECPNNTCTIPSVDWVEGVAIVVAIIIVVLVGAVNDYQKELQFRKLNAKTEDRTVRCIRDGHEHLVGVYDVVVGDICLFEIGEIFSRRRRLLGWPQRQVRRILRDWGV